MISYTYSPIFGQSDFDFGPELKKDRNHKSDLKGGSGKRRSRKNDGKRGEF